MEFMKKEKGDFTMSKRLTLALIAGLLVIMLIPFVVAPRNTYTLKGAPTFNFSTENRGANEFYYIGFENGEYVTLDPFITINDNFKDNVPASVEFNSIFSKPSREGKLSHLLTHNPNINNFGYTVASSKSFNLQNKTSFGNLLIDFVDPNFRTSFIDNRIYYYGLDFSFLDPSITYNTSITQDRFLVYNNESAGANAPPLNVLPSGTDITGSAGLDASDDSRTATGAIAVGSSGYQSFQVQLNVSSNNYIENITWLFEGESDDYADMDLYLYVWNYSAGSWINVAVDTDFNGVGTDEIYQVNITIANGTADFVNSTSNETIFMAFYDNVGGLGGEGRTDYIELTVDYVGLALPTFTLNNPTNNSVIVSNEAILNVTVDDGNVDQNINITFYLNETASNLDTDKENSIINFTVVDAGNSTSFNTTDFFSSGLLDGTYYWMIEAEDGSGGGNSTSNMWQFILSKTSTTLEHPPDAQVNSSTLQHFRCSGNSTSNIDNVTFSLSDSSPAIISTIFRDLTNAVTQNETFNVSALSDDTYNWNCEFTDIDAIAFSASANSTIIIDTTAPQMNIYASDNAINLSRYTTPLNISYTEPNLDSCWYHTNDDYANSTFTCQDNTTVSFTIGGQKTLFVFMNDSAGNLGTNSTEFYLNLLNVTLQYEDPVYEGETQNIRMNLSANSITTFFGNLTWNNTNYTSTGFNNGTVGYLTSSFVVPPLDANKYIPFYFNFFMGGSNFSINQTSQLAKKVTDLEISTTTCSPNLEPVREFDFGFENVTGNATASINYNFIYGIGNNTVKSLYGNLSSVSNFYLCINVTEEANYSLGYGEIQYLKDGYTDRRFYPYIDQELALPQINTTLYLLGSSSATSFLFEFKDTSLVSLEDDYASLLRWYPELNSYNTVEMGKTDEKGQTIMRVVVEDVDYRVGLNYPNGSLMKLADPIRFACLTSPCTYSLLIPPADQDFTSIYDVENSLTFNRDTNVFTFVWSDTSGKTQSMTLKTYKQTGTSNIELCTQTGAGTSGALSCNVSGFTGNIRAIAYRTASPETPIAQRLENILASKTFQSALGLFFALVIFTILVLIGIASPIIAIILGIVALIPAVAMGSVPLGVAIGLGTLGAIVIHFMKRSS